jgi:nucleotide-binding universal stress UspA family protein
VASEGSPVLVLGYDGSRESDAAVEYAARRAGSTGRLVVVHAVAPPPTLVGVVAVGGESGDHGVAVLDALLMEHAEALTATTFDLEAPRATPVDALLAAASEADADEIVVGCRGLGRIESALGSVSSELLRRADRPVVVIPRSSLG